jgi:hypothetical protein
VCPDTDAVLQGSFDRAFNVQRIPSMESAGNIAGADIRKNLLIGTYLEVAVAFP